MGSLSPKAHILAWKAFTQGPHLSMGSLSPKAPISKWEVFPLRPTSQHSQQHAAAYQHISNLIRPKAGALDALAVLQHAAHPCTKQTTFVEMGLVKPTSHAIETWVPHSTCQGSTTLQHHWEHCQHPPKFAADWYGTTRCLLKLTSPQATTICCQGTSLCK